MSDAQLAADEARERDIIRQMNGKGYRPPRGDERGGKWVMIKVDGAYRSMYAMPIDEREIER